MPVRRTWSPSGLGLIRVTLVPEVATTCPDTARPWSLVSAPVVGSTEARPTTAVVPTLLKSPATHSESFTIATSYPLQLPPLEQSLALNAESTAPVATLILAMPLRTTAVPPGAEATLVNLPTTYRLWPSADATIPWTGAL